MEKNVGELAVFQVNIHTGIYLLLSSFLNIFSFFFFCFPLNSVVVYLY